MEDSYGVHLMLRVANVERPDALDSPGAVSGFLEGLVARVGMSILAGPLVGIEHGDAEHYGVSGVVILKESHAAVHTYPGPAATRVTISSSTPTPSGATCSDRCFPHDRLVAAGVPYAGRADMALLEHVDASAEVDGVVPALVTSGPFVHRDSPGFSGGFLLTNQLSLRRVPLSRWYDEDWIWLRQLRLAGGESCSRSTPPWSMRATGPSPCR